MKRINEIFYSIQGEGFFAGTPAVFVRFSGCNLQCTYCDTDHAAYVQMEDAQILQALEQFPARHLVLTGGEPSLQLDTSFVDELRSRGYFVQVETNGTLSLPPEVSWVTCSPKDSLLPERADELKIVYTGQDLSPYEHFPCQYRSLQPCSCANTDEVIQYVLEHPQWCLSVQWHKYLQIP